jgi:hypothetical protein
MDEMVTPMISSENVNGIFFGASPPVERERGREREREREKERERPPVGSLYPESLAFNF